MDTSLFPGSYFDYPDDEVAMQRELELGETFTGTYVDDVFPPNARSLYLDPLNPPTGAIPNESIKWFSLCEGCLAGCEKPVLFAEDASSANIQPGALGNNYFINALSLIACSPKHLSRLMVSSKYASRGLYTFKFYKAGKWRYVHIDDHIPCRQSGKVHFCRNANPNETFAMLLEKAYAKLHGCYEALSYGLVEHALLDLTPAAGIQALRIDQVPRTRRCDEVWDLLDAAVHKGAIIGCGRFIADPLAENPAVRQGIDLAALYQVVDLCITSAEPTEDFDALTVGMICVRNLKTTTGRFNGRWSFGHKLWMDYKEIAMDLRHRTREIQHKRGVGAHPDELAVEARLDVRYLSQAQELEAGGEEIDDDDEPDTIDAGYQERRMPFKMVQPMADDLHWIQVEDFVELFNRAFVVQDLSLERKAQCKRYVSKWLPGDYLVGSGGPPVVIEKHEVVDEQADPPVVHVEKAAYINDSFTDNPMFPFTVNEPARVVITLYQLDKRWNTGRLGEDPRAMASRTMLPRQERLESVMHYDLGIAWIVVRLSGLKVRCTDFKLRKIAYTSQKLVFAHANNQYLELFPGRYALIPYTHMKLDRLQDYAVHFQYFAGQLEFEIDDPIVQRLQDREASDDGIDDEDFPEDNDLLRVTNVQTDDVSIMSFERAPAAAAGDEEGSKVAEPLPAMVPLPRLQRWLAWEYREDVSEVALNAMYGEVGSMMKYLRSLKGEIRKLNGTIRALSLSETRNIVVTPTAGSVGP